MTLYAAWADADFPDELVGPWESIHRAAPGLLFVDSADSLSRVYHELKWSLPPETGIVVVEAVAAKSSHVAAGTLTWWRRRAR